MRMQDLGNTKKNLGKLMTLLESLQSILMERELKDDYKQNCPSH